MKRFIFIAIIIVTTGISLFCLDLLTALQGKVLVSDKPFPAQPKEGSTGIVALRAQAKTSLSISPTKKMINLYYAAFIDDVGDGGRLVLRLYEISRGGRKLVLSQDVFKGQSSYVSSFLGVKGSELGTPKAPVVLVFEYQGKDIASSGRLVIDNEMAVYAGTEP